MREEFKSIEGNKIRTLKLHERAVDPDDEFGREVEMEADKTGVLEIRKLGHDQLRQLCIDMGWFNHVDNDRYNELLEYADKADITSADILYIAQRIYTSRSALTNSPRTTTTTGMWIRYAARLRGDAGLCLL